MSPSQIVIVCTVIWILHTSQFPDTAHTSAIMENRAVIRIVLSSGMWHIVKLTSILLRYILSPASSKSKTGKKVACRFLRYIPPKRSTLLHVHIYKYCKIYLTFLKETLQLHKISTGIVHIWTLNLPFISNWKHYNCWTILVIQAKNDKLFYLVGSLGELHSQCSHLGENKKNSANMNSNQHSKTLLLSYTKPLI